jgi:hypothetical protein
MTDPMSDDPREIEKYRAFLLDVQARLQGVEDLLMADDWQEFVARTKHGVFEWRLGGVAEPRGVRRKSASTLRKSRRRRL